MFDLAEELCSPVISYIPVCKALQFDFNDFLSPKHLDLTILIVISHRHVINSSGAVIQVIGFQKICIEDKSAFHYPLYILAMKVHYKFPCTTSQLLLSVQWLFLSIL